MARVNSELLKVAAWRVLHDEAESMEKSAIVPPGGGDPSMAGGGGAPPGGAAPPMDPAAMGGAPMDPSMAGGGGGAAPPGVDPSIMMAVQQAVQQAMGGAGGAGGKPGMGPGGGKKAEQAMLDTKMWQILKMLATIMNHMQIPVPADIVVGAPPDPAMLQMATQDTQSAVQPDMGTGGGAPGGSPIEPIQPMDPSAGAGGGGDMGGGMKAAEYFGYGDTEDGVEIGVGFDSPSLASLADRAEAFAALARSKNREMSS